MCRLCDSCCRQYTPQQRLDKKNAFFRAFAGATAVTVHAEPTVAGVCVFVCVEVVNWPALLLCVC